ncbi:N-6 DNA methylase [Corynebacterium neomassiliense]|uniref:N-6 DNA methylase n=1 Tax=Corynebacterium neomassiliense TaxID=2079482 RepID=UPI00192A6809|nr:N-6 DNA methylase [Corynebacterium neomassiliense]
MTQVLGCEPAEDDILEGLSIGEVGVCYEALMASMDAGARRIEGQYFTPDDAAQFMAHQSTDFPEGVWLDPCCGVGNLAWYLAARQPDPDVFVSNYLTLIDKDSVALSTAVALIGAEFLSCSNAQGLVDLDRRAHCRDFLSRGKLPAHDYVIMNPPYSRAEARSDLRSGHTRDLFAFFMERVASTSSGFISVTPASYLSAPKFRVLREVIASETSGGSVYVFDNVPDTLFRGYKFGSSNTSKTNFVRAAVTVCRPDATSWEITPILRWRSASRARMFDRCAGLLAPLNVGPAGEWAKLTPGMGGLWKRLMSAEQTLGDLLVPVETEFQLTVATTPRYYISATYRTLDRRSKAILHFANARDRDRAAVVLNSSLPYMWWRALDGGVTLPRRVLRSLPVPRFEYAPGLIDLLQRDEAESLVTKLNAGRVNENVKRPRALVSQLDDLVLPDAPRLDLLYADDMFPL